MTAPEAIDQCIQDLTIGEVRACRRWVDGAVGAKLMTDREAEAWRRRLDAWDSFLSLDPGATVH